MALQKWAAPAGVLLEAVTLTGPDATFGGIESSFAAAGDVGVGATFTGAMWGTITTTGSPHLAPTVSLGAAPDSANGSTSYVAPTGVTDQHWRVDFTAIVRSITSTTATLVFDLHMVGLTDTDVWVSDVGTCGPGQLGSLGLGVSWDGNISDADAGDIIVVEGAYALWIG